jgi:quinol-cytochrome oxidoreductase complex cytochrome b subunit
VVILLTWIGARPVEDPYILMGQVLTGIYFRYFLLYTTLATNQGAKRLT